MKNKNQYRQGDVLIERIAKLPSNLKLMPRENGRVILAHGEVTGHAHSFTEKAVEKFTDESGSEFFKVGGNDFNLILPIVREWKDQVMVKHPSLGLIEFGKSDVTIKSGMVVIKGEFGLLKHDEHSAHAVPAGFYKGGGAGGKVRQREYSPVAIRNVAD